jgi:hypothetical protein
MTQIAGGASFVALISLVLRHRNVGQILLKLALILLGPVIVCCTFILSGPGAAVFLKGFEQWILQEADIDAIQTWLVSEGTKHAGKQYSPEEGFHEKLPECLVELNPRRISFVDSVYKNGPSVEIIWHLLWMSMD